MLNYYYYITFIDLLDGSEMLSNSPATNEDNDNHIKIKTKTCGYLDNITNSYNCYLISDCKNRCLEANKSSL